MQPTTVKSTRNVFLGPRPISSAIVGGLFVRIFNQLLINFSRIHSITNQRFNLQQQHNLKELWRERLMMDVWDYNEDTTRLIKKRGASVCKVEEENSLEKVDE